ncbi:MAG: phosphate acyltransferase PlsX [Candidatus Omnitrophica bacterium]|nr:phosphate acyltransferase PlsX [Candidatus Omnitrophota bacterium]MBU4346510.1 phosphate acyltransferase PlsX [Candidatus Omnitrophota bacterium]MBU4472924.1 phosphate acyltransferase PlsX [Candidatus Omnitrophota bacterium]MCG2706779.1 phosphate acyltransferase PlsX [Candidatus Omnitrophota bacterium]
MKIIVDAMGGDYAPDTIIEGAIAAVKECKIEVILVGDEPRIRAILNKRRYDADNISVYPAQEVIEMSESAAISVRRKRNSSIVVGLNLIKEGKGEAFFSAGNTGAVVCAATLSLGLLPGIERAGIAIIAPSLKGISLIIDVGANIDPKPIQLLQYGIMADAYLRYILGNPNPKVGLLNIGEEQSKGTEFLKEAYELLERSSLNFIGNIEGKDIFHGKSDIVICDGFVGNIALKVSESLAEAMQEFLKRHLRSNLLGILGMVLLRTSFLGFKRQMDYSEYGGAPLLGINGVVIIGHGRSNANAIKNAIRVAKEEVERKFNEKILEAIKEK